MWSKERLYVLKGGDTRYNNLTEFHRNPYLGHLGYQKMISTVKRHFFWPKLKANIATFIVKFQESQLVKAEH